MGWEILVVLAFVVLTVGRILWEKLSGRDDEPQHEDPLAWESAR
jgi:hypothetical protein